MSKQEVCVCGFPTLSPFILGVCDKCGNDFFDTRSCRPLQTVTSWEFGKQQKFRILSTKENKEAMDYNEWLYQKWLDEHKATESNKDTKRRANTKPKSKLARGEGSNK